MEKEKMEKEKNGQEKQKNLVSSNRISSGVKIDMMEMLKAGVHFGHKKSKWNPKMKPYVYAVRDNIHIINLQATVEKLQEALKFIKDIVRKGGIILFVGTRRQAKAPVKSAAEKCGMPYVTERWIGGAFTNFKVVLERIKKLKKMEEERDSEEFKNFTKKEQLEFSRNLKRIEKKLGGIRNLKKLPEAVFVIDINKDILAVKESRKLGIPIIALADTNTDPTIVDYPIPSNDDAIQAIKMMADAVAEAVIEGKSSVGEEEEKKE